MQLAETVRPDEVKRMTFVAMDGQKLHLPPLRETATGLYAVPHNRELPRWEVVGMIANGVDGQTLTTDEGDFQLQSGAYLLRDPSSGIYRLMPYMHSEFRQLVTEDGTEVRELVNCCR